jgi:hypothetical protein
VRPVWEVPDSDYKRSGKDLLPRLERSRAPKMASEHHGEDEEEDLRVSLD